MKNKTLKQIMIGIMAGALLSGCSVSGIEPTESTSIVKTKDNAGNDPDQKDIDSQESNESDASSEATTESESTPDDKEDGTSIKGGATAHSYSKDPQMEVNRYFDSVPSDDFSTMIMEIWYPTIYVGNDLSDGGQLSKVTKEITDRCKAEAEQFRQSYETMACDEYEEGTTWEDDSYVFTGNGYTRRVDSKVFSMIEAVYSYAHGAHGNNYFHAFNYDLSTGKEIKLDDLVKDKTGLRDAVKKALLEKYDAAIFYAEDTLDETLHNMIDGDMADYLVFTVETDGVSIWFGDMDISSFLDGCQMVTIPYKGNEALFNASYISEEQNYVKALVPSVLYTTSSGHKVQIDQYQPGNSGNSELMLGISYDRTENMVDDLYYYELDAYLIHKDGKDFLYCQTTRDSDDHELRIYTLGNNELGKAQTPTKGEALCNTLVSADDFEMYVRVDALATMHPSAIYSVGPDGLPVTDATCYELPDDYWTLTLLQDFKADVAADRNSQTFTAEVLPAGTKMTLIRTNAKDYVDLILEDGRVARLTFDLSGYPHMIGGIHEEELFDGLMYCD